MDESDPITKLVYNGGPLDGLIEEKLIPPCCHEIRYCIPSPPSLALNAELVFMKTGVYALKQSSEGLGVFEWTGLE